MEEQEFLEITAGIVCRIDINKLKHLISYLESNCDGKLIFLKKSAGRLKIVEINNGGNSSG